MVLLVFGWWVFFDEGVYVGFIFIVCEVCGDDVGGECVGFIEVEVYLLVEGVFVGGDGGGWFGG